MPRPLTPFKVGPDVSPDHQRVLKKPDWFKIKLNQGERFQTIDGLVEKHRLSTVCKEARCPNIYECWNSGTATFMLMGDTCTRACKFCHIKSGNPKKRLDNSEPTKISESVRTLGLSYVVLTSVNRDDLDDEGAQHFAKTVSAIKNLNPEIFVEALTPDFRRTQERSIQTMIDSGVDVLAHNVETVRRLVPFIRDARCHHDLSLRFHRISKQLKFNLITKSSMMLGLGESKEEVLECMRELRDHDVDVVTLGQYLQPTKNHHPVVRYVHPDEFKAYEDEGLKMGFEFVASGPMIRSSYRAGEFFIQNKLKKRKAGEMYANI